MTKLLFPTASAMLAGLIAAVLPVTVAAPAHALKPNLTCKRVVVTGTGSAKTSSLARKKAARHWYDQVLASYGVVYAGWARVIYQNHTSCTDVSRPGNKRWSCRARGRPCRSRRAFTPHQNPPPRPANQNQLRRQR